MLACTLTLIFCSVQQIMSAAYEYAHSTCLASYAPMTRCTVYSACCLQADMSFEVCDHLVGDFRRGDTKILICTAGCMPFRSLNANQVRAAVKFICCCCMFGCCGMSVYAAAFRAAAARSMCVMATGDNLTCGTKPVGLTAWNAIARLYSQVTLVINYDMPEQNWRHTSHEIYQRISHSVASGRKGAVFNLITGAQVRASAIHTQQMRCCAGACQAGAPQI